MTAKVESTAQRLAEVVPRLMSAFHDLKRPHEGTEALTMRHFQAMVLLSVRSEMTLQDLCERLHLAPSTGSELVQRMIGLGYVQKSISGMDKREVTLRLTESGLALFLKRKQELVQIFQDLLQRFSDKDRQRLVHAFETIWELMQQQLQPQR